MTAGSAGNLQVIVLAAGEGSRLRPHTATKPKCLVPLGGSPLLDHQLRSISAVGIDDVHLVTGYCADQLSSYGFPTSHNAIYDQSNMVHSLMCARDVLCNGRDSIIAYADIVYNPEVLQGLIDSPVSFSTVVDLHWLKLWQLRDEDPLQDAETLRMKDGYVIELGKRPKTLEAIQGQYIGLSKIGADVAEKFVAAFEALPAEGEVLDGKDRKNMYMTSFLQHLIDGGWPLKATTIRSGWLEVDTVTDLALYERMLDEKRLDDFVRIP